MKKYFVLVLIVLVAAACGGNREDVVSLTGSTMGTTYSVKVARPGADVNAENIQADIDSVLKEVNRQMSTYIPDSEISLFNKSKDTTWFEVSEDFALVVEKALEVSEKTGGAFDITVGPLVNLWGFGPDKNERIIPPDDKIKEAMAETGYEHLSVKISPPAIKKKLPALVIDLSAIAKGFGVDKVSEYLDYSGFGNYMVEIGGEVRTLGKNDSGEDWKIGIASPGGNSDIQNVLSISGKAVATSGDYHNYFEVDGKRYSHTIDPRTGKPVTHKLVSVTIVYDNCTFADAYATAIDVMGPDAGFDFARQEELPVYLIVKSVEGFKENKTPLFDGFIDKNFTERK